MGALLHYFTFSRIYAHLHWNLISPQTTFKSRCCNQQLKFDNQYEFPLKNLIYMPICIIKCDTGWALQDWTQGKRADLLEKFPQHGELIKRLCKEWGSLTYNSKRCQQRFVPVQLQKSAIKDLSRHLFFLTYIQTMESPNILALWSKQCVINVHTNKCIDFNTAVLFVIIHVHV